MRGPAIAAWRRRLTALAAVSIVALAGACGDGGSAAGESGAEAPGGSGARTVKVAITPTMPYIGVEKGRLVGLDGDLFTKAAEKLGLKVQPNVVNFAGLLAGVQSHRYDIGIGDIFWGAPRAKAGLFTDPPYYSPVVLAERPGLNITTIAGLRGRRLGTGQGFVYIPALKKVPGATVRTYPTYQDVLQDLNAGRIDVAFLDPLTVTYTKQKDPALKYDTVGLKPPTAEELTARPEYSAFMPLMTGWYLNRGEKDLERRLTEIIRGFYDSGLAAELVRKYGGDPATMLKPIPVFAGQRHAADRPRDWTAPALP